LLGINLFIQENYQIAKHPARKMAGRQKTNLKQITITEIQDSKQVK
jgi:hypothetical protein